MCEGSRSAVFNRLAVVVALLERRALCRGGTRRLLEWPVVIGGRVQAHVPGAVGPGPFLSQVGRPCMRGVCYLGSSPFWAC